MLSFALRYPLTLTLVSLSSAFRLPAQPSLPSRPISAAAAAAAALPPALEARADEAASLLAAAPEAAWLSSGEVHELGLYLAKTVISWGVPAGVLGAAAIAVVSAGARASSDGSDDAPMLPPPLAKALGVGGEPKEYLQIEKLNEKLTSFEYSLRKASVSPASAKRERARQSLARQFGSEFAAFGLDAATVERVLEATKAYRKKEERLTSQIEKKLMAVRADKLLARGGGKGGGSKHAEGEASAEGEEQGGGFLSGGAQVFARMGGAMGSSAAMKEVSRLQQQQIELELSFLARLSEIVSKDQAAALASVLQPSSTRAKGVAGGQGGGAVSAAAAGESLGGRLDALNALVDAATEAASKSKHVYVLKFFGDVTASQVAQLRQEITAVLTSAEAEERADEVVLVLNTGGGTVTGYGLAASQLLRLKEAGLPLTICVEQVAPETPPRRLRDASETPPRRLRDASETPRRRLRDASETPPRRLRDASKTPRRHLLDTPETPPTPPLKEAFPDSPRRISANLGCRLTTGAPSRSPPLAAT